MKSAILALLLTSVLCACATPGGEGKSGLNLSTLTSVFDTPGGKTTLLSGLRPQPYEASLVAVGTEKDLAHRSGEGLGYVRSEPIERYLDKIREKLLAASGITGVPGHVRIQANAAYTASASADGNIYFSMAWMKDLENEDEVAAILAHELAHILLKHHSTDIVSTVQKRLQAGNEILIGAKLQANKATQLGKGDQRSLRIAQMTSEVLDKLAMPAWNRRQETEADLLGTDLMLAAGYSPAANISMLEKLRAFNARNKEPEEKFQERVQAMLQQRPVEALSMSLGKVVREMSAPHPATDDRIDSIAAYLERHYASHDFPEPATKPWRMLRSQRNVAEMIRNYDLAYSAHGLLKKGNAKLAYDYAREAVKAPSARHAYPNWILAQSAAALGKSTEAIAALKRAIDAEEPVKEVYKTLADTLEQSGKLGDALFWVDKASSTFGDAPEWAPDRIRLLRKLGRTVEAGALLLKCQIDTPQIRHLCHEAHLTPAPTRKASSTLDSRPG